MPHKNALTVNGKTMGKNCSKRRSENSDVIKSIKRADEGEAGFINLKGNLFDSAIMKTSVISHEFRDRYLSKSQRPDGV